MHYRQEQLVGIPLKVKLRKLYGRIPSGDDFVKVGLVYKRGNFELELFSSTSHCSSQGGWDEWIDMHVLIPDLDMHCHMTFKHGPGHQKDILLHDGSGFLKQGIYKILMNEGSHYSADMQRFDQIVKRVDSRQWKKIEWLDTLTFEAIRKRQYEEALENDMLFLIIEFPKFDAPIKMSDALGSILEGGQADCIKQDNLIRPCRFMPSLPRDTIIKPSPRSLPVCMRLQREAAVHRLDSSTPGLLWKYKEWTCTASSSQCDRLICHLIKSVDLIDEEEVDIAKKLIGRTTIEPPRFLSSLVSMQSLLLHNPHLTVFDEDIALLMRRSAPASASDSQVYVSCMFIKDMAGRRFRHTYAWLCSCVRQATKDSLYASMAAYWLLEREDLIEMREWRDMVGRQRMLIDCLQSLVNRIRRGRESRLEKRELLCKMLRDPPEQCPPLLAPFLSPSISLPTEPGVCISGVVPDHSTIYKSTAMPVKISFLGDTDCQEHSVIIKTGESLECDLLVMRLIILVDELWKSQGMDYCVQTYSILPISHHSGGWLQYVPSSSLSAILQDNGNSLSPYLMTNDNIDRYLSSCAAYCVISYVLGVGDRHLENLLLTPDGRLFHVDYAYLFGSDPKPFPPPMKLCKEMVEAMGGGMHSEEFQRFKALTLQGYQIARVNAGLIIDFLALHGDVVGEAELLFVRNRLAMDRSDAEALDAMDGLIEESVNAMFPQVIDTIHKWTQYWRI